MARVCCISLNVVPAMSEAMQQRSNVSSARSLIAEHTREHRVAPEVRAGANEGGEEAGGRVSETVERESGETLEQGGGVSRSGGAVERKSGESLENVVRRMA